MFFKRERKTLCKAFKMFGNGAFMTYVQKRKYAKLTTTNKQANKNEIINKYNTDTNTKL